MSRMSRSKGKRGEREVRDVFIAAGIAAERGGWKQVQEPDVPDVVTVAGLHMEVKRCERITLPAWLAQAEAAAALSASVPAVAFRQSRQPWRVVVPLDYLAALVAAKENQ